MTSCAPEHQSWTQLEARAAEPLIQLAIAEDLGAAGDRTSQLLPQGLQGRAALVARSPGVVAGLPIAPMVYRALGANLQFSFAVADGEQVSRGTALATIQGLMRDLLTGERMVLNFLQRLSGVATQTRRFVDAIAGLPCRLLDTRKTTPGWRALEKYAVRCGGGENHRMGLFDGVMFKDNHLAALGRLEDPIGHAVAIARAQTPKGMLVEVEVDTLEQLGQALKAHPDRILLDNMSIAVLSQAVERRDRAAPDVQLEASGGITLDTARAVAETGVDYISSGALTHSAPALDIALDYRQ